MHIFVGSLNILFFAKLPGYQSMGARPIGLLNDVVSRFSLGIYQQ